ncbi:MAG: Gfo/Idh/MocA family oxidoreductase [Clostridiales Family XIII bacterium]|nr:Gfo/Idh/MocA family oxidoreductase [Clostridiales Family XIII bacterium]
MKQVTAVLIGAGDRGTNAFGPFALNNPGTIQFVAVVDRDEEKRRHFQRVHGIPDERAFDHWDDLFARGKIADAILICTNEKYHYEPTKQAMAQGYHILLEKPITQEPETCVEIGDLAARYDKVFMLGYVLRYTPFFSEMKRRLEAGAIGQIRTILLSENTGMAHFSHSYVRGIFGMEAIAGPMILSKCCHDMDILNWLTDSRCVRLSSFASDTFFKAENAPPGVPKRCTDGCPISDTCYYYAPKMYSAPRSGFNVEMISVDQTPEGRMKALEHGPFGRCVYHCENNAVDTQVINMLYANGVTVSFSMTAYSDVCYRMIKISGTEGEIAGNLEKNEFTIKDFASGRHETVGVSTVLDRHSGGDYFIMSDFVKHVRDDVKGGRTDAAKAVDSHVMCFAAEKSRKESTEIDLEQYKQELRR